MNRRETLKALAALGATGSLVRAANSEAADTYPAKPIRMVLPAAVGGAGDRYARLLAKGLGEGLGQNVIVDNKPGAGGNIGADLVAKSPPDGYTLLFASQAIFAMNPHIYRKLSYTAREDFIPVAPVVKGYMYLFVPGTSPANNLAEWMQHAKMKSGGMSYGSPGIGTSPHVAMEWIRHKTGLNLVHVPYKGGTPSIVTALFTGEIDAAFDFYTPVMAQVKAGKLKALGITSLARNPAVPDIPTIAEQGIPGLEVASWSGVFAPKGTSKAIIGRLNEEITRVRAGQDIQQTIANAGGVELKGTPEEFATFVRKEYEYGAQLVKVSGATLE